MYYVPDGTEMCGYYECKDCGSRFLDVKIGPQIVCPYCGEEPDMEIGPDEEMPKVTESAKLIQVVRNGKINAFDPGSVLFYQCFHVII